MTGEERREAIKDTINALVSEYANTYDEDFIATEWIMVVAQRSSTGPMVASR